MALASAQSVLSSSAGGSESAEPSESDAPRRRPKRHKNVALSSLLQAASFAAAAQTVRPPFEPVVHIAPADVEEGVCVSVVFCCQVPAVNNRDTLYLQLAERQEQLQLLCELLEEEAVDQQLVCAPPPIGSCVLACWEGGWYRARVVRLLISDDVDMAELLYLDYGNTDRQPWRLCRRLTTRHIAPPAFALRCQLLDVQYCPVDSVHRRLQLMVLQAVLAGDGDGLRARFHLPDEQSSSSSDDHHLVELSTPAQVVDKAGVVRPLVLLVSDMLNRVQHLPLDEARRQVQSERVDLRLLTSDPIDNGQPEQSAVDRLIEEQRQTAWQRRHRPQTDVGDWLRQMPVSATPPPDDGSSVDFCPLPARSVSTASPAQRLSSKYRHMELKWDSRPNYRCALDFCSSLPRSDLLLVNVQSIDQFFLAEAQGDFERFQEDLNVTYGCLPLHPCQLPEGGDVKSLYTPGSYWVARWELEGGGDQSTQWCRATIVSAVDLPTLQVFWVDYCETSTVSAGQLRPISARLAARPVFVTRAFCADAAALPDQRQSETTARFIELVDQPLLNVRTVRALSSDECLAVQLFTTDGAEVNSVAQILAREGLATVRDVQNDTECEEQTQEPQQQDVEDDVSSGAASAAVQTNLRKELLVRRQRAQLRLPGAGSVLYVRVTRLTSPLDMHVVLPFGVTDARYVARHRRMVTHRLTSPGCLEGLAKEMRRHYGGPAGGGEFGRLRPLQRGAMVAVPWRGSWQRGRIAQLLQQDDDSEDWASVTLVDWGLHTRAAVADLRQLLRRFSDLPHQAVMCRCQEQADGPRWTTHGAAELLEHAQHGFLLADILAVDAHNVTITVQLYTAQGVPLLPS